MPKGLWAKETWCRAWVRRQIKSGDIDDWERRGLNRYKCLPVFRHGVWVIDMQGIIDDQPIPKRYWTIVINTCKECRWWKIHLECKFGICQNLTKCSPANIMQTEGDMAYIEACGPDFGCIHWEAKKRLRCLKEFPIRMMDRSVMLIHLGQVIHQAIVC